jgi:hypothetical protein
MYLNNKDERAHEVEMAKQGMVQKQEGFKTLWVRDNEQTTTGK